MAWSFRNELARKMLHLSVILLLILYIIVKNSYGKEVGLFVLMTLLIIALIYEYLRLNLKLKLPLSELTRLREKNKHSGLIYMVSGLILSLAVFEEKIAYAAILMGIFGDFVVGLLHGARIVGFSYIKKRRKPYELFIEFVVNFIVGIVILPEFFVILFMAITATIVELMFDQEDNLAIPIFSGFVGQLLSLIIK